MPQLWMRIRETARDRRSAALAILFGGFCAAAVLLGRMLEREGALSVPGPGELAAALLTGLAAGAAAIALWAVPASDDSPDEPASAAAGHPADERAAGCSPGTPVSDGAAGTRPRGAFVRTAAAAWDALPERRRCLYVWLLMMAVCLLSLLAVYPGFFVYDAAQELSMVQTRNFTTHHPLLHVLLLGGSIQFIHKLTDSYNIAIFVYLLLQMAVLLAVFTWLLSYLRRRRVCCGIRIFGLLWFLLCPTVTMFVLCSCKDTLFSAALIIMTVQLCRLTEEREEREEGKKREERKKREDREEREEREKTGAHGRVRRHCLLYILSAAAMMLLRNNGVYAYAVFLVFACAAVWRKARRVMAQTAILLLIPILLYGGVSKGLKALTGAASGGSQEILTVPIMQLARTWNEDPGAFDEDDRQLMASLMEDGGWEQYEPKLSDTVKDGFRSEVYRSDSAAFWDLWLRQGLRHPGTYLTAWLMTSYAFWYPGAVIDCYEGNVAYTFVYGDSSYFGYETEEPGERRSLFPALDGWYRFLSLDRRAQETPVLRLILSPGALLWVFLFMLLTFVRSRRGDRLMAYLPMLLVWMTTLLGPCTLPRYVVYLWFGLPLFAAEISARTPSASCHNCRCRTVGYKNKHK